MKRITIHDKTTLPTGKPLKSALEGLVQSPIIEKPTRNLEQTIPYIIEDATFNGHIPRQRPGKEQPIPTIEICMTEHDKPRRFMHTRPSDMAEALNSQLDRYAERAALTLGLKIDDFANPGMITPAKVTIVGRIVGETEGRLNERGILLEASRQMGSGCRIPLELGNVPCSFHPGQMVILEGNNPDGSVFHVSNQIIMPSIVEEPRRDPTGPTLPLTILVASGPYMMDNDEKLDFGPFERLLNFAFDQCPQVLILMGPFVDAEHSLIKGGKLNVFPEELFHREFVRRICVLTGRLPTLKVILLPSTRDLMADNVLPQPPYPLEVMMVESLGGIFRVPNPAWLTINGTSIGLCSSDVLLPLGMEEFFKVATTTTSLDNTNHNHTDRMGRLCGYLYNQASFYPLYPAPIGTNIDYNLLPSLEFSNPPDILITVSQLRFFAKSIDDSNNGDSNSNSSKSTLFINPGQFCRKQAVGTAAFITLTDQHHSKDKRVDFYQF